MGTDQLDTLTSYFKTVPVLSTHHVPVPSKPPSPFCSIVSVTGISSGAETSTVPVVAPDAGDLLGPLRAALGVEGVVAAASAYDGRLAVRMMAADGWPLRRQIVRALAVLHLPRRG